MSAAIALQPLIQANIMPLQSKGMLGFCRNQRGLFQQYAAHNFSYPAFATRTGRATKPLQTPYDMLCYNALYAPSHYTLFSALLDEVDFSLCTKPLKIFDYGCGQGLASLSVLERLRNFSAAIELHLVELSQPAIFAAEQYATSYAAANGLQLTIHSHNQSIDSLADGLFDGDVDQISLHLFSNVLDIAGSTFDLNSLIKQIQGMPGTHICLGSGPCYSNTSHGFNQLVSGLASRHAKTRRGTLTVAAPYAAGYFSYTGASVVVK